MSPPDGRPRAGPRRAEIVSTAVVVVLVAVAVVALWPRGGPAGGPADTGPGAGTAVAVDDAELAPLRAAAGLAACPVAGTGTAAGPLAGVTAACLGAPGSVDVGAALAGRPVLVNVWASWCEPCRAELPVLAAYAAGPGAVDVLLVDVQDDPRAALRLLAGLGVTLPSLADTDGSLRAALDIPPALPISYVVGADGRVARVDPPTPFHTPDEVTTAVARLVGNPR